MTETTQPAGETGPERRFQRPSGEQISEALGRLGDYQHRRIFYSSLANPEWIAPLAAQGAFAGADHVVAPGAGAGALISPWPEGEYLVRMSNSAPEAVATVLGELDPIENELAQSTFVLAVATLPPAQAKALVSTAIGYFGDECTWLDCSALIEMAKRLLAAGHWKEPLALLNEMFQPKVTSEWHAGDRTYPVVGSWIADHDRPEMLSDVVETLVQHKKRAGVRTVVGWLESYQELAMHYDPDWPNDDSSHHWRRSIAPHPQNHHEPFGDDLVEGVRQAIRQLASIDGAEESIAAAKNSPQPLLKRIIMDFISDKPNDEDASESDRAFCRDLAAELLVDEHCFESVYRVEYANLARSVLPSVSREVEIVWLETVMRGPFLSDTDLQRNLTRWRQEEGPATTDELKDFRERWSRDLLAAVGVGYLPESGKDALDALEQTHGQAGPHVEFPTWSETTVGWQSPITDEEFKLMAIDDVLRMLVEWEPDLTDPFGPTRMGLARQLEKRILLSPDDFAVRAADFAEVDLTYQRSVLIGLAGSSTDVATDQVLELLDTSLLRTSGRDADDQELDSLAHASVRLVLEIVQTASAANVPLTSALFDLIAVLANDPDPPPYVEADVAEDDATRTDPYTNSLNSIRPMALRSAVHLLQTVSTESASGAVVRVPLLAMLAQHAGLAQDGSLAVQAMFGQLLGTLFAVDETWTTGILDLLLGDPSVDLDGATPGPDTVWSTFLKTHKTAPWMVQKLHPYFEQRVRSLAVERNETEGWRTNESSRHELGVVLIHLYIGGVEEAGTPTDGLLGLLLANSSSELAARILRTTGWTLGRSDDLDDLMLLRARELWDEWAQAARERGQLEELMGFASWVTSGKFSPDWWLPRLSDVAAIVDLSTDFRLGERLAAAAEEGHALPAVDLLSLLWEHPQASPRAGLRRAAPRILANALDSGSADAADKAAAVLNAMGRGGYLRISDEVQALRDFS